MVTSTAHDTANFYTRERLHNRLACSPDLAAPAPLFTVPLPLQFVVGCEARTWEGELRRGEVCNLKSAAARVAQSHPTTFLLIMA